MLLNYFVIKTIYYKKLKTDDLMLFKFDQQLLWTITMCINSLNYVLYCRIISAELRNVTPSG